MEYAIQKPDKNFRNSGLLTQFQAWRSRVRTRRQTCSSKPRRHFLESRSPANDARVQSPRDDTRGEPRSNAVIIIDRRETTAPRSPTERDVGRFLDWLRHVTQFVSRILPHRDTTAHKFENACDFFASYEKLNISGKKKKRRKVFKNEHRVSTLSRHVKKF